MKRVLALLTALFSSLTGCGLVPESPPDTSAAPTAQELDQGLIWLFPGLVGDAAEVIPARDALRDAGISSAIRLFSWSYPPQAVTARAADRAENDAQAAAVAADIVAYRAAHPSGPIDLVGYSAGAYFAIRAVELLPAEVRVRNVLLAQPDLSPQYDLTPGLAHVDGQVICFYSPADWLHSGLVSTVLGTMDRVHATAAGRAGFSADAVADESLRPRLLQLGWDESWAAAGHSGWHLDILGYEWNRAILAPHLLPGADGSPP